MTTEKNVPKNIESQEFENLERGLEAIVDKQIEAFDKVNCPESVLEKFRGLKPEIMNEARELLIGNSISEGNSPILLVIPERDMPLREQLSMIGNGREIPFPNFHMHRRPEKKKDVYSVFNVNNGTISSDQIPVSIIEGASKKGRRCFEMIEAISFVIQEAPERNLIVAGSFFENGLRMPSIVFEEGGNCIQIETFHAFAVARHESWRIPSCNK